MTSSHPLPVPCQWFSWLAAALDRRSAPRLALIFLGAVLARGRRTVTTWIRAAKLSGQYQSCYLAVAAAGKRADRITRRLLTGVVRPLLRGARRPRFFRGGLPTPHAPPPIRRPPGRARAGRPSRPVARLVSWLVEVSSPPRAPIGSRVGSARSGEPKGRAVRPMPSIALTRGDRRR